MGILELLLILDAVISFLVAMLEVLPEQIWYGCILGMWYECAQLWDQTVVLYWQVLIDTFKAVAMASYQLAPDREDVLTIWTASLGSQGLYFKVSRNSKDTNVLVENIMRWLSTKMQLVNSHMPLLARGQRTPTAEGGDHLP